MTRSNISFFPGPRALARPAALSPAQERCDEIQASLRAKPGDRIRRQTSSPQPLPPSPSLIERRLAEEIDYTRRVLQAMGERLANDPLVIARHPETLQGFDVVGQMLGYLGSIVGTSDRREAVERIGMADLRGRIQRRSLAEETLFPEPGPAG